MEITKALDHNSRSETKYATLHTCQGVTTFKIRKQLYQVSPRGWDDTIALKDVEYNIIEGVLFLKGTKVYHYSITSILGDLLTSCGKRSIWKLNDEINNRLAVPFEKEEFVIRKFFFFKKRVMAFNLEKITSNEGKVDTWYLSKDEYPYEIALSNFELIES